MLGDAERLPFADGAFDSYTIAFGIRNVTRIPLALAERIARKIKAELEPLCEPGFLEIAGSIRRRRAVVGDIDVVCIPKDLAALKRRLGRNATALRADGSQNLSYQLWLPPDLGLPRDTSWVQIDVFLAHQGERAPRPPSHSHTTHSHAPVGSPRLARG